MGQRARESEIKRHARRFRREEIFGPVLSVSYAETLDDDIQLINRYAACRRRARCPSRRAVHSRGTH